MRFDPDRQIRVLLKPGRGPGGVGHNLHVSKAARGDLLVCLTLVAVIAVAEFMLVPRKEPILSCHHRCPKLHHKNAPAYLEYGRRMRTGFAFGVRAMCAQNADLIKKFKAGEYTNHEDRFEADTTEFCNSLMDSMEQFDSQEVPEILARSHAKIMNCNRLCYQSVQTLRQACGAEGAEQTRLLQEAEWQMKRAWATGDAGVKLHNQIWASPAQRASRSPDCAENCPTNSTREWSQLAGDRPLDWGQFLARNTN